MLEFLIFCIILRYGIPSAMVVGCWAWILLRPILCLPLHAMIFVGKVIGKFVAIILTPFLLAKLFAQGMLRIVTVQSVHSSRL